MDKLREIIGTYNQWQSLEDYIGRIEGFRDSDFPLCVENAKAMLEAVGKEICDFKGQVYNKSDSTSKVLKLAFNSLGYDSSDTVQQIARAIANIGTQMSLLRNEIGATSHGKPLAELEKRKDALNKASSEFLLLSTELVCSFLIQLFETERSPSETEESIDYDDNPDFNEALDDQYGTFEIAAYSFTASTVLFTLDQLAYRSELNDFREFEAMEFTEDEDDSEYAIGTINV
jgi:hypothetical protein